jgi:hypothetical protein
VATKAAALAVVDVRLLLAKGNAASQTYGRKLSLGCTPPLGTSLERDAVDGVDGVPQSLHPRLHEIVRESTHSTQHTLVGV